MARKVKDLFVVLAEQHKQRQQGASSASTEKPSTAGEIGNTLGRWVQGAVRTLRGTDEKVGRRRRRGGAGRKPNQGIRQVPRGLLLPGWMLGLMVVLALGCGFVLGRLTGGFGGDDLLFARTGSGVQKLGEFENTAAPGYLPPAQETRELGKTFFVVRTFYPEQRAEAAALAQHLRARGLENTRIKEIREDGSIYCWATLCYAAQSARKQVLAQLLKLEKSLGFEPMIRQLKEMPPPKQK